MMTTKYLKVGFWNAGSLGTKHDEFIAALLGSDVDIMAINETWLRTGEEGRAPSVPGYRLRHVPRSLSVKKGRGGGVGFYIKHGINIRNHSHSASTSHATVEQMWLTISVRGIKLAIGTAYRPPWQDVDTFLDAVSGSVNSLTQCEYTILMGDFNINMLNVEDSKTDKLVSFLNCLGFKQLVQTPTHFTVHGSTLIDIICTNVKPRSVSVDVIPDLGAHALVSCEFSFKRPKIPLRTITYRPLKDIVRECFDQDLELLNWEAITELQDVNDMVNEFNSRLLLLLDIHAPLKTGVVKECCYPWITDNVKFMMQLRNKAHAEYLKDRKSDHKKIYYKELKSLVSVSLFYEKSAYYKHKINCQINDSKALWKNLKSNLLPSKHKELPLHFNDPNQICDHFLNVPGTDTVSESMLTFFESTRNNGSTFVLSPTTSKVIANILKTIKSNAEGCDGITISMIFLTLPVTLDVITALVNASITSSSFPDSWKIAKVLPLPKTLNASDMKDLRPVSILPVLSKVLEKVVCAQLVNFLETNRILPDVQSGFRKGRSTTTALLDVTDNILSAQDNGMCTLLVLLDFSRAFDCINVPLLLSKMVFYGFDKDTVKWFESYLSDRTQFVEIRRADGSTVVSRRCSVGRGVPQGSILGPVLFILYCADLIRVIKKCKYHIYADDTQVYISFKPEDYEQALKDLNADLESIVQWSNSNTLALNPTKTKFMLFGTVNQLNKIKPCTGCVTIMGQPIERVYEARNLGLIMDAELRFHKHVTECIRNCYYRLKILYKARPYLSEELRVLLVESLVLSKLNYADTLYGQRLLSKTERMIQRLQNSCARFCFKVPFRGHVTPFLNEHNILKMKARRKLHLATLLFGVIKSHSPSYLYDRLSWTSRHRIGEGRKCSQQLSIPQHKTAAFRGSFRYAATKCWNNIPPPIKFSKSCSTFKSKLKLFLLNHQNEFQDVRADMSAI